MRWFGGQGTGPEAEIQVMAQQMRGEITPQVVAEIVQNIVQTVVQDCQQRYGDNLRSLSDDQIRVFLTHIGARLIPYVAAEAVLPRVPDLVRGMDPERAGTTSIYAVAAMSVVLTERCEEPLTAALSHDQVVRQVRPRRDWFG